MFVCMSALLGLWLGLFICVTIEVGFFIVLIFKLDWTKVTQKVGFCFHYLTHRLQTFLIGIKRHKRIGMIT